MCSVYPLFHLFLSSNLQKSTVPPHTHTHTNIHTHIYIYIYIYIYIERERERESEKEERTYKMQKYKAE